MMEGGEVRLTHLPAEILVNILLYLDLQSINQLEKVCFQLQELIATSLQIWKQKIILLCSSDLIYNNVLKFSRYEKIKHSSSSLRTFYSQILSLRANLLNGIFNKQTINCLEAKFKDRRVLLNIPVSG
ncbi:uncharacterized protein LOC111715497 isoform X2 [Eurytemora carolleeae]|uniref:uncharacterized protein LOC111715497 isoform X2 n=1 Tax=Eurytemora carolleeae TaxID=1294199 RepID=UPI000C7849B6|nr:uncharacterized protein LOC111715497 isoform X2 [Eurytemora carolleeae]|eukprot:XP_023346597.1 uncharacterized protein LOC111715497 isoform X2 [Eurytemora affinis]